MAFVVIDEHQQIENTLRRVADDVAYVSVRRIVNRKSYEPLGRRDFNSIDLSTWMADDDPEAALELDEAKAKAHQQSKLVDATMKWLVDTVETSIGDRAVDNYQVQFWRAKGLGVITSCRCTAHNQDAEVHEEDEEEDGDEAAASDDAAAPEPTSVSLPVMPIPPHLELPAVPANAWDKIAQTSNFMLQTWERQVALGQHMTANAFAALDHAGKQVSAELRLQLRNANTEIARLHGLVTELHGQLIQLRIGAAELGQSQVAGSTTPEELRVRESMAKSFIEQLGSLGRMALSTKLGMDPALVGLIDKIMADEPLVELLKHPEVQEMFAEPGATGGLKAFLEMALEQHRANKAAKKAEQDAANNAAR